MIIIKERLVDCLTAFFTKLLTKTFHKNLGEILLIYYGFFNLFNEGEIEDENNQNSTICLIPKKKEYLNPLPNKVLLDNNVDEVITQTVSQTLLATYKGSGYSVSIKFNITGRSYRTKDKIDMIDEY